MFCCSYYVDPHQPPPGSRVADEGEDGDQRAGPLSGRAQEVDPEELLRQAEQDAHIDEVGVYWVTWRCMCGSAMMG